MNRLPDEKILLFVILPLFYAVLAAVVAASTHVLKASSIASFSLLYAMLALLAGAGDYYRLHYGQDGDVWVEPREYKQAVLRGHALTFLLIGLGWAFTYLADIENGWPIFLAFIAGPVSGRALAIFSEAVITTTGLVYIKVLEIGSMLLLLGAILFVIGLF